MSRDGPLPESWKRHVGVLAVVGGGTVLLTLHFAHAIDSGESLQTFVLGIMIPMGFAVGVLGGGVWLRETDYEGKYVLRVAGWCLVGSVVGIVGAVLVVLYQQVEGVIMSNRLYTLANAATGGGIVGFVVGVYDVRQRRARRRTARLNRQLTVLNRVLRHDIRNTANVIRGRVEHLSRTDGDHNGNERQVETIRGRTEDLVELGNHAGTIERLIREPDQNRTTVDIGAVLEAELDGLADEYPMAEIRASVQSDATVHGHPLVESAVRNVLDNAVEHNEKETPRVEVECERVTLAGSEYVEVSIADNGPGIPDEEVQILERGYETSLEHTKGLGLWVVHWIVTASNGIVSFEENALGGSTVRLRFESAGAESASEQQLLQRLSAGI